MDMTLNVFLTFMVIVTVLGSIALYCQSKSHSEERETMQEYIDRMNPPNISEPVYQMAKIIKDNPKLIKVKYMGADNKVNSRIDYWEVTYTKTGEVFVMSRTITLEAGYAIYKIDHSVIFTQDECMHLFSTVDNVFIERKQRYQSILRKRLARRLNAIDTTTPT